MESGVLACIEKGILDKVLEGFSDETKENILNEKVYAKAIKLNN